MIKCGALNIIFIRDFERSGIMAGHGRPPVEEPRIIKVGFRATERERDLLLAYCEKKNLTQAQVFKEALELLYKTKP